MTQPKLNTLYTNDTGGVIDVQVTPESLPGCVVLFEVDGKPISGRSLVGEYGTISGYVPAGSTYQAVTLYGQATVDNWVEIAVPVTDSNKWADVSSNFVLGTTYINTTGAPVAISYFVLNSDTDNPLDTYLVIDEVMISRLTVQVPSSTSFTAYGWLRGIIPAGSSYRISADTNTSKQIYKVNTLNCTNSFATNKKWVDVSDERRLFNWYDNATGDFIAVSGWAQTHLLGRAYFIERDGDIVNSMTVKYKDQTVNWDSAMPSGSGYIVEGDPSDSPYYKWFELR